MTSVECCIVSWIIDASHHNFTQHCSTFFLSCDPGLAFRARDVDYDRSDLSRSLMKVTLISVHPTIQFKHQQHHRAVAADADATTMAGSRALASTSNTICLTFYLF